MKIIEANSVDRIADKTFIVIFSSRIHCAACKVLKRTIVAMPLQPFYFYEIDLDKHPDEGSSYSVMALPTIMFFRNNRVMEAIIGAVSSDTLEHGIEDNLL